MRGYKEFYLFFDTNVKLSAHRHLRCIFMSSNQPGSFYMKSLDERFNDGLWYKRRGKLLKIKRIL